MRNQINTEFTFQSREKYIKQNNKIRSEEHSIIESFKETDPVASCFAFNEQVSSLAVMLKVRSEWQEGIKHIKIREKCISGRGLKLQGHRTEGEFDGNRWVSGNKIRLVVKCQIIQGFQTNKQFVFYSEMPHWYQPGNHKRLCWDEEGGDSVQNGCWCSPLRYLDSLSMSAKLEEKKPETSQLWVANSNTFSNEPVIINTGGSQVYTNKEWWGLRTVKSS